MNNPNTKTEYPTHSSCESNATIGSYTIAYVTTDNSNEFYCGNCFNEVAATYDDDDELLIYVATIQHIESDEHPIRCESCNTDIGN